MMDDRHVHVLDADDTARRWVARLLGQHGFSIEHWTSGAVFIESLAGIRPGCVLLDLRLPGVDGLGVQETLNARSDNLPIVFLTDHGDIKTAVRAIKAGAVDFLEKPVATVALLAAVEAAFDRKRAFRSRQVARAILSRLTERETDVLRGLVDGSSNKRIAGDLQISSRTVEIHRANIMAKLGARSLSEVLRIAFASNID